jgi:hypothetical protein
LSGLNSSGYLFLCSNKTQKECFQERLFGLPQQFLGWVQQITIGTPIFLYNINSDTLFGTFKASSNGGYNLNPRAWGNMRPFEDPAQVRIEHDIVHKIETASKKCAFLKKNFCKLTAEQTNGLNDRLTNAVKYEF